MTTQTKAITAIDASTTKPVAGAQVFVNGASIGYTDSSGNVPFVATVGQQYLVGVRAVTYKNAAGALTGGQSLTVPLTPLINTAPVNFSLTIYPESPALGVTVTFTDSHSNVQTAPYTKGGIKITLAVDTWTVTGSVTGFVPFSAQFDTALHNTGTIQLVSEEDAGKKNQQTPENTQDPNTATMLPTIVPEQVPEFVAPNTGQGTYFTLTQARIYIGNLFIDELNSIQFALQDNKIPIFGYASRFWDDLAQGKSLVQGQLTINFVSEGYLYKALTYYQQQISNDITLNSDTKAQQEQRLLNLTNALQNPDPTWSYKTIQAAKDEIQKLMATIGPDAATIVKSNSNAIHKQQSDSILGLPGGDYKANPLYQDVQFDVVLQFTGAGRTITRRLEKCTLISNESILAPTGEPILDAYGFIARRLR